MEIVPKTIVVFSHSLFYLPEKAKWGGGGGNRITWKGGRNVFQREGKPFNFNKPQSFHSRGKVWTQVAHKPMVVFPS